MTLMLLDVGFYIFHTILMAFNMVGWIWRKTRVAHLVVLGLTLFSWVGMGAYYGWGYCLCTDWHFRIRRLRGEKFWESSFVQTLVELVFGVRISHWASDALALGVLIAVVIATAIVWTIDRRGRVHANITS